MSTLADEERMPIELASRCQHCMFYKEHSVYSKPCKDLGVYKMDPPCSKFFPNLDELDDRKALSPIIQKIPNLTKYQRTILASLLATTNPQHVKVDEKEGVQLKSGARRLVLMKNGSMMKVPAKRVQIA